MRPLTILFIGNTNSCLSLMAEALLKSHGGEKFVALSAGKEPADHIDEQMRQFLIEKKVPVDALYPKSWDQFRNNAAELKVDVIITLDDETKDASPPWVGVPVKAHWSVDNPLKAPRPEDKSWMLQKAHTTLESRIQNLVQSELPEPSGELAMKLKEIGMS
jgi:arsenate reductase